MCPQGMIATGGGYTTGGLPNVEVTIATPSGPVNGPATGYLFGAHNKNTSTNVNILVCGSMFKGRLALIWGHPSCKFNFSLARES
jgi:hypothetical protein